MLKKALAKVHVIERYDLAPDEVGKSPGELLDNMLEDASKDGREVVKIDFEIELDNRVSGTEIDAVARMLGDSMLDRKETDMVMDLISKLERRNE